MSKQAMLTLSAVAALCVFATLSIQARAAGQEGWVVVRDAQTGKLRAATPDEIKALRAAAPPNAALTGKAQAQPQANMVTRPNGTRGVHVGDSHKVFEVVTRGADGKLSSQCVQGEHAATEALTHPANAADKESAHESR